MKIKQAAIALELSRLYDMDPDEILAILDDSASDVDWSQDSLSYYSWKLEIACHMHDIQYW